MPVQLRPTSPPSHRCSATPSPPRNPTVSPTSFIVSSYPSGETRSYPFTWQWHVSRHTPTGTHSRSRSTSSATCSKLPPSENSAPAVFSISTRNPPAGKIQPIHRPLDPLRRQPQPLLPRQTVPASRMQHQELRPPCQPALHLTPKRLTPFSRTLSVWLHRLIR